MRVEYINPFVETSYKVLKEVLGGIDVKRGDLYLKSTAMPVMGVAVASVVTLSIALDTIFLSFFSPKSLTPLSCSASFHHTQRW